ncbi:MAG: M56 family metallopeptidase, partial [Planctomycetota bacterium]
MNETIPTGIVADGLVRVSVLLAVTWAFQLLLRRANPRLRITLWRVSVTACLCMVPLTVMLTGRLGWSLREVQSAVATNPVIESWPTVGASIASQSPNREFESRPAEPVNSKTPQRAVQSSHGGPPSGKVSAAKRSFAQWLSWPLVAAGVWLTGSLICLTRIVCQAMQLRRLVARSRDVDRPLPGLSSHRAALRLVDQSISPCVIPAMLSRQWRPVILISQRLFIELERRELEAVLVHEATHVRHRDAGWNSVIAVLQAILWWNPLCWAIRTQHQRDCEHVCDWTVVRATGDGQGYQRLLARLALAFRQEPRWLLAPSGVAEIVRRVEMVLHLRDASPARLRQSLAALMSVVCAVAVASAQSATNPSDEAPQSVDPVQATVQRTPAKKVGPAKALKRRALHHETPESLLDTALQDFDPRREPSDLMAQAETPSAPQPNASDAVPRTVPPQPPRKDEPPRPFVVPAVEVMTKLNHVMATGIPEPELLAAATAR